MKKTKVSGLSRLVAFLLIATVLICIFGFSAEGWQSMSGTDINSGEPVIPSGESDVNKDTEEETIIPEIKYYDYLTGLEVSEEDSRLKKTAFVINSSAPSYGLSKGEVVIEFPTESGETRLLMYTKAMNTLGKIGSVAPTRGFISDMIASFDGVLISFGEDDTVEYSSNDISGKIFDLSENPGYSYTEYTHFVYSNHDLIKAGLSNLGFSLSQPSEGTLPFFFSPYVSENGNLSALSLSLSFSDAKTTELYYDSNDGRYYLFEGGIKKSDALYNQSISYKNVFVLFSDSVTYETESGSELIMNMKNGGKGYYAVNGHAEEITWENIGGSMRFKNKNGEILNVAAGESYIGFLKSSDKSALSIT